jgi:translocation and assembly module TamA
VDNDPIGGRSLAEFGAEARIRFGSFGIVPFLDGGNLYTQALPRFTGFRYGTGLGIRYYSSCGPIRLDVGTPINPQPGDKRIAVYVSLGQAF